MSARTSQPNDVLQQLGCICRADGLELPHGLTREGWAAIGRELGRQQDKLYWEIGDWWNYPGHRYGTRQAIVDSEDWTGPAYSTCFHYGSVADAFEPCRRRQSLTFSHHLEVADLPAKKADELLDYAEATIATTGKPRSVRALREEKNRRWEQTIASRSSPSGPKTVRATWYEHDRPPPLHVADRSPMPQPTLEPEVQEQLRVAVSEISTAHEMRELALPGILDALRLEGGPADLREMLEAAANALARY